MNFTTLVRYLPFCSWLNQPLLLLVVPLLLGELAGQAQTTGQAPASHNPNPVIPHYTPSSSPTSGELCATSILKMPVVDVSPSGGSSSLAERQAFATALVNYRQSGFGATIASRQVLENFLLQYPSGGFALSVQLELAECCWNAGAWGKGISHHQAVWAAAKSIPAGVASLRKSKLQNQAAGKLALRLSMLARINDIDALAADTDETALAAAVRLEVQDAVKTASEIRTTEPTCHLCGIQATNAVQSAVGATTLPLTPEPQPANGPLVGLTLKNIIDRTLGTGNAMKAVKRVSGGAIPVPSVMHWSLNHFSAITERNASGKVRLIDESREFDAWVEPEVLLSEGSGLFAISASSPTPDGFVLAAPAETIAAAAPRCKPVHYATKKSKDQCHPNTSPKGCGGMAVWGFDLFTGDLVLQDQPLSYPVPYGSPVSIKFSQNYGYSYRMDGMTQDFGGWNFTYSSRIVESNEATRFISDEGASISYSYSAVTSAYTAAFANSPKLEAIMMSGIQSGFRVTFADGSVDEFKQPSVEGGPNWLLTARIDVHGNKHTVSWSFADYANDEIFFGARLSSISDHLGNITWFEYDDPASRRPNRMRIQANGQLPASGLPAVATKTVVFEYNIQDATGDSRLKSITDPQGIESRFISDDGFQILKTPYGTVDYSPPGLFSVSTASGAIPIGSISEVVITAADGTVDKERVFIPLTSGLLGYMPQETYSAGGNTSPWTDGALQLSGSNTDMDGVPSASGWAAAQADLRYQATFYWDKKATGGESETHPMSLNDAVSYHWKLYGQYPSGAFMPVPASTKRPGTSRVWYVYNTAAGGTLFPIKEGRFVENESGVKTWVESATTYSAAGLVASERDEAGMLSTFNYAAGTPNLTSVSLTPPGGAAVTVGTLNNYSSTTGPGNRLPGKVMLSDGLALTMSYNNLGQTMSRRTQKEKNGVPIGTGLVERYWRGGKYSPPAGYSAQATGYVWRVEAISPANPSQWVTVQRLTYDDWGRVKTVTDGAGYTKTYTYDNLDRVISVQHPDRRQETFSYKRNITPDYAGDDGLDLESYTDQDGRTTRTLHNHLRKVVKVIDPLSRVTQIEWCKCGSPYQITDPDGKITRWKRDLQGRPISKTLADGSKYLYAYEPFSGRLKSITYPQDALSTTPMNNGNELTTATITYKYQANGRLAALYHLDNRVPDVFFQYDSFGRVTLRTDGTAQTKFTYNSATENAPFQLKTEDGPLADDTLVFTYDELGRMTGRSMLAAGGGAWRAETWAFDSLGRLKTETNGLGTFNYYYNPVNGNTNTSAMVTSITGPGGLYTHYGYANALPNAPGSGFARLASFENGGAGLLSSFDYTYTAGGQMKSWTRRLQGESGGLLDAKSKWLIESSLAGELSEVKDVDMTNSQQVTRRWSYSYDGAGNRSSRGNADGSEEVWTHNERNQLTQTGGGGKTTIEGSLDKAASVVVKVNDGAFQPAKVLARNLHFYADATLNTGANTITVRATNLIASNPQGGQTEHSYTMNVTGTTGRQYFDTNGNLIARHDLVAQTWEVFTWDGVNRLTGWERHPLAVGETPTVQAAPARRAGSVHALWEYDGLGRRVKETNGVAEAAPVTPPQVPVYAWADYEVKRYIWSGMELLACLTELPLTPQVYPPVITLPGPRRVPFATEAMQSSYYVARIGTTVSSTLVNTTVALPLQYYRQGEVAVDLRYNGGGAMQRQRCYTRDHLGSVRDVLERTPLSAGYTPIARYDYDPYGQRTRLSGTEEVWKGFTGHRYHPASGLHLAPYRAYDAKSGRWLSEDPIEEAGGLNLYGYVNNRPLSYIDPKGLIETTITFGGGATSFGGLAGGMGIHLEVMTGIAVDWNDLLNSKMVWTGQCAPLLRTTGSYTGAGYQGALNISRTPTEPGFSGNVTLHGEIDAGTGRESVGLSGDLGLDWESFGDPESKVISSGGICKGMVGPGLGVGGGVGLGFNGTYASPSIRQILRMIKNIFNPIPSANPIP